jgi:hypothetical protein
VLDVFARAQADLEARTAQMAATAQSTGGVDPAAVAQLQVDQQAMNRASAGLKQNLDLLATNPQLAEQRIVQAATQPTIEGIAQTLAT